MQSMASVPQPDPTHGVFATMLVVEGKPLELEPHLAQLGASVRELYELELPEAAPALATDRAQGLALGRLRLSISVLAGREPLLEAVARPIDRSIVLPGWDGALELRTAVVEGWRGGHKWADRRLLEQLDAQAAPAGALLVDGGGRALETTRANVFAVGQDGVLRTPPTDGAILPGTMRALVIVLAREAGFEVREEPIDVGALCTAREVFATGSLRGVEPVRALDGVAIGGWGDVTAALADALGRRWLDDDAPSVPARGPVAERAFGLSKPTAWD